MVTNMNPIKELETKLVKAEKEYNTAYNRTNNSRKKLEEQIRDLQSKLDVINNKIQPKLDIVYRLNQEINDIKPKCLGPWIIDLKNREARLYLYQNEKNGFNNRVWFRGVINNSDSPRKWTATIHYQRFEYDGEYTEEKFKVLLKLVEDKCKELGYIIIDE